MFKKGPFKPNTRQKIYCCVNNADIEQALTTILSKCFEAAYQLNRFDSGNAIASLATVTLAEGSFILCASSKTITDHLMLHKVS